MMELIFFIIIAIALKYLLYKIDNIEKELKDLKRYLNDKNNNHN